MGQYIGEFAAIGTALMFALGSTLFTLTGREIGSGLVNRTRLLIAVIYVLGFHWLLVGNPFAMGADTNRWFWLGLSGLIGLALGDASVFQAFVMIGPRISMLIMSLSPVIAAILSWLFLGEVLSPLTVLGIIVTVAGIGLVVAERQPKSKTDDASHDTRHYIIGLLFALGGALGQAVGFVFAKVGLADDFSSISALLIRLTIAMIAVWVFSLIRGQLNSSVHTLRAHPRAVGLLTLAAFLGPVIGVWLSLVAVQQTEVGIASTLIALTPIFLMPIAAIVFKDRITLQAIIGTLVAFGGTSLLFL